MKLRTSELTGPALDWAVAKCEGVEYQYQRVTSREYGRDSVTQHFRTYSTNWSQAGPIIEREMLCITPDFPRGWTAITNNAELMQFGPTPLIAAMHCYVESKLGEEVEIPEELGRSL